MKKLFILGFVLLIASIGFSQDHNRKIQKKPIKDVEVIRFFNKTNVIIRETGELVKKNQVYTGGVKSAIDFQQKATEEFKNGENQKAVNDSYIARRLAFRAHMANNKGNKGQIKSDWELNEHEQKMVTVVVTKKTIELFWQNKKRKNNNLMILI